MWRDILLPVLCITYTKKLSKKLLAECFSISNVDRRTVLSVMFFFLIAVEKIKNCDNETKDVIMKAAYALR